MTKKITQFFKETPAGVFDVYVGYIAEDKEIVFRVQRAGAGLHKQAVAKGSLRAFINMYEGRPETADELIDDLIESAAKGAL